MEPPAPAAPGQIELASPIEKRYTSDGTEILEALPTALSVRPMTAADLCVPGLGTERFTAQIRARVHGVDVDVLEWRIDPAEADAAYWALIDATGVDLWNLIRERYLDAGGEVPGADGDALVLAWQRAALAAVTDDHESYILVRCRTPSLGTLKVGPLRLGHLRIHREIAAERTEWDGRLAALSKIVGKTIDELRAARIEDANTLWSAVMVLQKKTEDRANLLFARRLSTRSTGGGPETSKT